MYMSPNAPLPIFFSSAHLPPIRASLGGGGPGWPFFPANPASLAASIEAVSKKSAPAGTSLPVSSLAGICRPSLFG